MTLPVPIETVQVTDERVDHSAPFQLQVPFALALCAGMRQGDALIVTWSAYNGQSLTWIASKNNEEVTAPVGGAFKTLLDKAKEKRGDAVQIALNSYGEAWSESGFRASFFKRVRDLREAKKVQPGCTYHGLRQTIGALARDAGFSDFQVASAIGDRSTKMAEVYGRDADRGAAQAQVLGVVQKHFANIDWKPRTD